MVFLSGPRQVGKTTLAKELMRQSSGEGIYFNWDLITDRKRLTQNPYFFETLPREPGSRPLLVFDEIHKYSRWKSYLKGVYDGFGESYALLVTGSGRLNLYKKGGDSLLGRYVALPLFPLTIGEILGTLPSWKEFSSNPAGPMRATAEPRKVFERLLAFTGFPEPYVRANPEFYRTWSAARNQLLVREDIRDATNIRNISQLELLVHLLEPRVGSPLSINSLREDLNVAFETVRDWLEVLANFYYFFWVPPYSRKLTRAIRKERKIYLYDWGDISSPGARFENLVALHLWKAVQTWTALGETRAELYYLRDKEKRETDFLLVADRRPVLLIECKIAETQLSPDLLHFQQLLNVPLAIQLVSEKGHDLEWKRNGKTQRLISADRWLAALP
jgi:predicted AAA+ superfamily ATPase